MRRPVNEPFTITTEFGTPDSYAKFGYHSGVDYAVPTGTAVYAPVRGTVVFADFHPIRGNMVCIFDGQHYHRLMHNSQLLVSQGQQVAEGVQVSLSGSTGLSTGPHVHWDINNEGVEVNSFDRFIDPASLLFASPSPSPSQSLSLAPNQRLLESLDGVNQRTEPTTSSAIIKEWPYDQEPFSFDGFTHGQDPYGNGNDIWFHGAISGGWFYSGCFQNKTTSGLAELPNPTNVIVDVTPPTPSPTYAPLFEKELACVTSVFQVNTTNYQTDNFPVKPTGVVLHDFGTDGRDTLQSSLNQFRATDTTAPHFTVSGDQIIQTGKLSWRMYHAGPKGNDKIGVEIDPDFDTNPKTQASVRLLLKALDVFYGYHLEPHKHSEYMATSCGDDIKFELLTEQPPEPTPAPQTNPTPVEPTPPVNPVPVQKETVLKALIQRAFSTAWQAGLAVIVAGAAGIVDIKSAKALAIAAIAAAFSAAKNAVQKPTEG